MTEQKDYYGTKRVTAWPNDKPLGPSIRADVGNGVSFVSADLIFDPGYAIRYPDGYLSWSPKAVFEAAYMPTDAMDFGRALQAMRDGAVVVRTVTRGAARLKIEGGVLMVEDDGHWFELGNLHANNILATDWRIVT